MYSCPRFSVNFGSSSGDGVKSSKQIALNTLAIGWVLLLAFGAPRWLLQGKLVVNLHFPRRLRQQVLTAGAAHADRFDAERRAVDLFGLPFDHLGLRVLWVVGFDLVRRRTVRGHVIL